jgi:hypothetical protein
MRPAPEDEEIAVLRKVAALALGLFVMLGAGQLSGATAAGDAYASSFVAKANAERGNRGLKPYVVKADLAAVAARHSARMAKANSLYHNPNLGSEVSGWQVVGENVGNGGTVDSIHQALMDSPTHRANILARDYIEIGVGTVKDSRGVIWVTQVFRLPMASPKVAAPVTQQASRSVVRVPVAPKPVAKPVAQPAAAPKAPVTVTAPVLPDGTAFLAALAPRRGEAAAADPLSVALEYADTLAALSL